VEHPAPDLIDMLWVLTWWNRWFNRRDLSIVF